MRNTEREPLRGKHAGGGVRKNGNSALIRWIPAIALALATVLAGCPTEADDVAEKTSHPLGLEMSLSGQVYVRVPDSDAGEWVWDYDLEGYRWVTPQFRPFHGNRKVLAIEWRQRFVNLELVWEPIDLGGEGNIDAGKLTFSLGRPPTNVLSQVGMGTGGLFEGYQHMYSGFSIYPGNARGLILHGLETETVGGGPYGWIERQHFNVDGWTSTLDEVLHIYVDRDVAVTGRGITFTGQGYGGTWSFTTNDINIMLKEGWNVMHVRSVATETPHGGSEVVTMRLADPDWVGWKLREGYAAAEGSLSGVFQTVPDATRSAAFNASPVQNRPRRR